MKSSNPMLSTVLDHSTLKPTWVERMVIRYLNQVLKNCCGSLKLIFPSQYQHQFGATSVSTIDHNATVVLYSLRPLLRLFLHGANGWSDAYIENEWSSPNLLQVIKWALLNQPKHSQDKNSQAEKSEYKNSEQVNNTAVLKKPNAFQRLCAIPYKRLHRANANTKQGSKRNIAAHYDLGNDFFKAWLDPGMTYSAALFNNTEYKSHSFNPSDNASEQVLAQAQKEKYQRILELLNPRDLDHIIEIGCGWGEFATQAAKTKNIKIDGITLSHEQLHWAQEKIIREGLNHQTKLELMDYRDIARQYDGIVSIEMFEAVGEENWDTYFQKLTSILKPEGKAVLQIITIDDERFHQYRKNPDFIQRYIFPGGMLPSVKVLSEKFAQHGLVLEHQQMFGMDYAKTLAIWWQKFEAEWSQIAKQNFDEKFYRMWRYYLAYCQGGFEESAIDVGLFVLTKSKDT